MPLPAATLDAILKATGSPVVFRGVAASPPIYGKLRSAEQLEADGQSFNLGGTHTTLRIREGAQPSDLAIDEALVVGGVTYEVRSLGCVAPDGTRTLTLVEV